jgi:hypothetical protein
MEAERQGPVAGDTEAGGPIGEPAWEPPATGRLRTEDYSDDLGPYPNRALEPCNGCGVLEGQLHNADCLVQACGAERLHVNYQRLAFERGFRAAWDCEELFWQAFLAADVVSYRHGPEATELPVMRGRATVHVRKLDQLVTLMDEIRGQSPTSRSSRLLHYLPRRNLQRREIIPAIRTRPIAADRTAR